MPPEGDGEPYKRLVAIDGRPLTPAELASAEADHQRDLADAARRRQHESADQRERRLAKEEEDRTENRRILEDALAVFKSTAIGRDTIDGETVVIILLVPRPEVEVKTREGAWMKKSSGRAWFVERDGQLVRLDMQMLDDVSVGWGIVGRLRKGSRLVVDRRRVGQTWLPSRMQVDASGRTLLFRSFDLESREGIYRLPAEVTASPG